MLPDAVLVFTVLDQCKIGRDNFLGQASVPLTYAMSKPPPLTIKKPNRKSQDAPELIDPATSFNRLMPKPPPPAASKTGFSRARVPSAPASTTSTANDGDGAASPVSPNTWMSRMAAMRQQKSASSSSSAASSSRLSVSRASIDGSNHNRSSLSGSGHGNSSSRHRGSNGGKMQFTLKCNGKEQSKAVALSGHLPRLPPSISTPITAYDAAAAQATPAGAATTTTTASSSTDAGAPGAKKEGIDATAALESVELLVPTSFDKTRAFDFGELQAAARWSPLHLCR